MGGVGFIGLLTICLIVLKLTETITISWWWVFSPILVGLVLWVLLVLGVAALGAIFGNR